MSSWRDYKHLYRPRASAGIEVRTNRFVGSYQTLSEATTALARDLGVRKEALPRRRKAVAKAKAKAKVKVPRYQCVYNKANSFEVKCAGAYLGRYRSESAAVAALKNFGGEVRKVSGCREQPAVSRKRFKTLKTIFKDSCAGNCSHPVRLGGPWLVGAACQLCWSTGLAPRRP